MTPLPWGDMIFPHLLISFHQKPEGGKGKRMGHSCSCDVIWSDWSSGDGLFQHGWCTHYKHVQQQLQNYSLLPQCTGKQQEMFTQLLRKDPGGYLPKAANPVDLLYSFAYLHLPWWLLLYYKESRFELCLWFCISHLTFHSFFKIHSVNVYWVSSVCQTLLHRCWVYAGEQKQTKTLFSLGNEEMGIDNASLPWGQWLIPEGSDLVKEIREPSLVTWLQSGFYSPLTPSVTCV